MSAQSFRATRRPSTGASPIRQPATSTTTPATRRSNNSRSSSKPASASCLPCSPTAHPRHENRGGEMAEPNEVVSVRYMVDDVEASVAFYTKVLEFEILNNFAPAFADVARGNLRLLLSGPTSSAGRPMPDGAKPVPGGWNRIHLIVLDIDAEVARLRDGGARFRNDILEGPGGKQVLLQDPSGNVVELFQPAQ